MTIHQTLPGDEASPAYNYAYLDEQTKRMIRRAVLKAVLQAFRENNIRAVPKPLTGDPVAAV